MLVYASTAIMVERHDSIAGAAYVRHSNKAAMNEGDMLREKALLKRHSERPHFQIGREIIYVYVPYIYIFIYVHTHIYNLSSNLEMRVAHCAF